MSISQVSKGWNSAYFEDILNEINAASIFLWIILPPAILIRFLIGPLTAKHRRTLSITIVTAWQEHNSVNWKQVLAAEQPALLLSSYSFFAFNPIMTVRYLEIKRYNEQIFHM